MIFGSLFHTNPSISIPFILVNSSCKSVSCSQTFTSKTMIDLAIAFFFYFLTTTGLAAGFAAAQSSSSPNRSSSSSFFVSAFFFYYFFPPFFPPLNASWASLGRSLGPTSALAPAIDSYQLIVFWNLFLCPSPNITLKITETLEARERSAMEIDSPTKNFDSDKCFSTTAKNLFTPSISFAKSTCSPFLCSRTALATGSNSVVVKSNH